MSEQDKVKVGLPTTQDYQDACTLFEDVFTVEKLAAFVRDRRLLREALTKLAEAETLISVQSEIEKALHIQAIDLESRLQSLKEENERLLKRMGLIEMKEHLQTIDERDAAEEALSQAYYLAKGNSPQWSNMFGYQEALNEIEDVQKCLKAEIKSLEQENERLKHGGYQHYICSAGHEFFVLSGDIEESCTHLYRNDNSRCCLMGWRQPLPSSPEKEGI